MFSLYLPQEIFGFLLVFSRLGSIFMVLPALGETAVPIRVRLILALGVSLLIYVVVRTALPDLPATPLGIFMLIFREVVVGLLIGTAIRLIASALHVAGTIIAMQTGLAVAQAFDPVQGAQSALMGTFLTLVGTTLILVTDLHHMMILAMRDSYVLFPAGSDIKITDFAQQVLDTVAGAFRLGVQIAMPFIVYGLIFNIGLGILARLMPQLQVFFIAMPLNIIMGFLIFLIVIGAAMAWFLEYMEKGIGQFLA
ncbi:flagellar biosynthetic protein FliR [Luteithermobacter gelatinilyticus]|uniref:flagellar biosynthetic protein FliR n=1 Tax=Luteithermobacter gelatinilyticus TaxID=2582913 RepID=UPI001106D025|nr:flagellar biosynthetic protein FliR [Luteithermobacter gelatinilyticus]